LSQSNNRHFTALHDQMYAHVVARGGGSGVDDIVVDTFMVAWRRPAEIPGQPLPWLIGAARNVCVSATGQMSEPTVWAICANTARSRRLSRSANHSRPRYGIRTRSMSRV
jgi:DNA-directed RNA polymerase specialized sigma24 family protein